MLKQNSISFDKTNIWKGNKKFSFLPLLSPVPYLKSSENDLENDQYVISDPLLEGECARKGNKGLAFFLLPNASFNSKLDFQDKQFNLLILYLIMILLR